MTNIYSTPTLSGTVYVPVYLPKGELDDEQSYLVAVPLSVLLDCDEVRDRLHDVAYRREEQTFAILCPNDSREQALEKMISVIPAGNFVVSDVV